MNIIKTLATSKLTFICGVNPHGFAETNNIIFNYIWKHKNPKLKKTTITKGKKEGGFGMIDFSFNTWQSAEDNMGKAFVFQ